MSDLLPARSEKRLIPHSLARRSLTVEAHLLPRPVSTTHRSWRPDLWPARIWVPLLLTCPLLITGALIAASRSLEVLS